MGGYPSIEHKRNQVVPLCRQTGTRTACDNQRHRWVYALFISKCQNSDFLKTNIQNQPAGKVQDKLLKLQKTILERNATIFYAGKKAMEDFERLNF